jgi:hypothetical protein
MIREEDGREKNAERGECRERGEQREKGRQRYRYQRLPTV